MTQYSITGHLKTTATRLFVAMLILSVAFVLRLIVLPIESGLPYITFYPATIICFYFCGNRIGGFQVILSAAVGYFVFAHPYWSFEYKIEGVVPVVAYLFTAVLVGYIVSIKKKSERRYQALLEDQTDFISRFNADGTITYVNQAYCDYFGISKDVLIGSSWKPVAHEDDLQMIQAKLSELSPENPVVLIENRIILKNKTVRWAQFINRGFFDDSGKLIEIQSVGRDMSRTHELQDQLMRFNKEQELMLDNELVGIIKISNRKIIWANRAMQQITGYSHDELIGQDTRIFYRNQLSYEAFGESLYQDIRRFGKCRTQLEWKMKGDVNRWVDLSGANLNPMLNESLWLILDISELKKDQLKIEYMAHHDALTGLENRISLSSHLNQLSGKLNLNSKTVAVCYLDLDNFKPVNDCYGHDAGDVVLVEVAKRIQKSIRNVDIVSRLGGDEFVILITELDVKQDYLPVLNRVINEIKQPINLPNGATVQVGASIGVCFMPLDSKDPAVILRIADEAMYQAKANGRDQIIEYGTLNTRK